MHGRGVGWEGCVRQDMIRPQFRARRFVSSTGRESRCVCTVRAGWEGWREGMVDGFAGQMFGGPCEAPIVKFDVYDTMLSERRRVKDVEFHADWGT